MFSTALALTLLPLLAVANPQYGYNPAPAPATTNMAAATVPTAPPSTAGQVNIEVAAGGNFVFSPANVTAPNGTMVTFFFPNAGLTHSVTQGDFSNPCEPIAAQNGQNGFDSGLQAGVQFTLNVTNDQIPIYFFCKQQTHCGLGMVGSINAPATGNTFDAWQAAAIKVGSSEPVLQDNGFVSGGIGAVATAAPTSSSGSGSSGSGTTSGAAGLGVSSVIATVFGVALAMLFSA
ncbi:hypothetical protein GY45DRAFT_387473 [Cubamyces sp. BRFM 1775]|nr:hypothetical protein GY45DRAFT_387473 [Cubamyces sp. BRFM 1775]